MDQAAFYFDLASPYAYLASHRVERVTGESRPHTVFCDGHAYMRILARDLRAARRPPAERHNSL